MSEFKEFPKMMRHPAAQAAVLSTIFPLGYKPKPGEVENPGRPATLPPVTVNDANQQAMYEARGYLAEGEEGAIAFAEAQAAIKPEGYAYEEYPKWVRMHDEDVLVKSKEEEHELLGYSVTRDDLKKSIPEFAEKYLPESLHPKKKPGPPKGYKRKPRTDHMTVTD